MDKEIDDNLNKFISQNLNTSENILQIMKNKKENILLTFNKIGKIYKNEKENKKKCNRIFELLDIIFNNIQNEQSKVFTQSIIFEEIKAFVFQKYFASLSIEEYIKTYLLKWYEIFFVDSKYEELIQTLTEVKVIPGDYMIELKAKLDEFENLKNQHENQKKPELKKKIKDLADKINNHPRLPEFLDSSQSNHVGIYFNMTDYIEKFDLQQEEISKEDLIKEVIKYKSSLSNEVDKIRKELMRKNNQD